MLVTPVPTPSAQIHEVVCAVVAPSACAAWNTTATELVNPTSTAMKPATTADTEISLSMGPAYPTLAPRVVAQRRGPERLREESCIDFFQAADETLHFV